MVNFDGKVFHLKSNSAHGTSNADTVFQYQQEGDLVTARFKGGAVVYGSLIGLHKGTHLEMVYQMLTLTHELKSGKAIAQISLDEHLKVQLDLNWEWLASSGMQGSSTYVEA